MAMAYTLLIRPGDQEAAEWYERYQQYCQLDTSDARWYAWRYEPDVWLLAVMTPLIFCGPAGDVKWWVALLPGLLLGGYWAWVFERKPRVRRKYERLLRKRRILRVPSFLLAAVDGEARRLGMLDWDKYPTRRFAILRDVLLESDPWLRELRNDCGCRESCGHTNRLSRRVREKLRYRVQATARRKLVEASHDHTAAIEMNRLRHQHIRGALGATAEEDD